MLQALREGIVHVCFLFPFFCVKKFGLPKNASHNKDAARTVQVLSIVGPEDRDCILQMQASNLKEQCTCASRHRALGLLLL